MALTNEDLLAISQLLDVKLKANLAPIEQRLTEVEQSVKKIGSILENDTRPRSQNIEACHTSTYDRYQAQTERYEAMQADIDIMKKVIAAHSEQIKQLQRSVLTTT